MRSPLALVALVLLAASLCFAREDYSHILSKRYGLGDPNAQCWTKPFPSNATALPAPCPTGLNINFTYRGWPQEFFIDSLYNIEFIMTVALPDVTSSPDEIPHANVHGCVQAAGFCSPILAQQPGLVSFFGQATANISADNTSLVTSPVRLGSVGIWSLICHGRVVRGVAPNREQVDFAYGVSITVKSRTSKVSRGALIAVGVIAGILALASVVLLIGIIIYRKHKVIRAATFPFCVIMLVCGIIALGTIVPLGVSPATDDSCVAIPWLLAPATCLILSLLALRLFRVQVLFGEAALHPDMKRYWYLRNFYLLIFACAITGIQVLMLIIWSSITAWRPRQVKIVGEITVDYGCGSNNSRAMPALYWTFVAMDALILAAAVALAFITRKVTTLFNESKAIALITYTFVFIGFVIIPIQKLVSDVTGIFVLRAMGIILGVGAAIVLLFAPKFYIIFTTNKRDLRGVDLTGSGATSAGSASSGDFDTAPASPGLEMRSSSQKPAGNQESGHIDKKTMDRLDAATQRAVMLLEKHKTGFRVGAQEMQEVIDGLKAV